MKRWVSIDDRSVVAALRRQARRHGLIAGLSERRIEELAIVVTEAATNVLRYGARGRALMQMNAEPGRRPLTLLVADRGPGIADVEAMLRDGASSSNSAGLGLGAIARLSDDFDLFTQKGEGTVLVMGFGDPLPGGEHATADVEGFRVSHPAEQLCGDEWAVRHGPDGTAVLVCDGLGHGRRANEAAREVVATAMALSDGPAGTLARTSAAMTGHRGAVAAMVEVPRDDGALRYAGVGNIASMTVSGGRTRRFAVKDGRIGGAALQPYEETRDLAQGETVILHSDGLKTLREGDIPPALLRKSPLLIAGYLLDRNFRGRDDACIVVLRRRTIDKAA